MEKNIKVEQIEKFEKKEKEVFKIVDVVIKMDKKEEVTQIRFRIKDSEKDLTFKPSYMAVKQDKIKGIKVEQSEKKSYLVDDLPEKIFDINDRIKENGFCDVETEYTISRDYTEDGEQIEYKFVNNYQFDSLTILN